MDAGHLIAIAVVSLYTIFGPVVLFAIYVLFDYFSVKKENTFVNGDDKFRKDPALWFLDESNEFISGRY